MTLGVSALGPESGAMCTEAEGSGVIGTESYGAGHGRLHLGFKT